MCIYSCREYVHRVQKSISKFSSFEKIKKHFIQFLTLIISHLKIILYPHLPPKCRLILYVLCIGMISMFMQLFLSVWNIPVSQIYSHLNIYESDIYTS